MRSGLLAFLIFLLCGFLPCQDVEDDGPFSPGWRDVAFKDTNYGRGTIQGRVYYPATSSGQNMPADPSQGPFPFLSFLHGWIEPPSDYDDLCNHLASWGFVIMSNDTETGLFPSMQDQSKDTQALMQWVEDQSLDATSWLAGMTGGGNWGAMGHSMGASATAYLANRDPRIRWIVMFEPYLGSLLGNTSAGFNSFRYFTGSALVVAGDEDLTNNWSSKVRPWYDRGIQTNRKVWSLIQGSDHFGCTDPDIHGAWGNGSLAESEQHRLHRILGAGFLRAEMKGEEYVFDELVGLSAQTDPTSQEAASLVTPLWFLTNPADPTQYTFGSFSQPRIRFRVAGSLGLGSTTTPFGELLLDTTTLQLAHNGLFPASGIQYTTMPISPAWSGLTLHFQALANEGRKGSLSRAVTVVVP